MRILVFGKNGQVARCLQDEAGGADLTALGSTDCNLMTPGAGAATVKTASPDIVINAAAYTAVDKAEDDKTAAFRLNAEAPGELARAAQEAGARFIHISTDYVFNGEADASYTENSPTSPINYYGASKLIGEETALASAPNAIVLRTSWVFSEYGANFVKTMLRLGVERDALKIVGDQVGGPTPARDIAKAILTIAGKITRGAPGAGIYHYQGTPAASWAEFAERIFDIAELTVSVEKIPTADYPTPARRPLHTVLDCARIERDFGIAPSDWRAGLRQTLAALKPRNG